MSGSGVFYASETSQLPYQPPGTWSGAMPTFVGGFEFVFTMSATLANGVCQLYINGVDGNDEPLQYITSGAWNQYMTAIQGLGPITGELNVDIVLETSVSGTVSYLNNSYNTNSNLAATIDNNGEVSTYVAAGSAGPNVVFNAFAVGCGGEFIGAVPLLSWSLTVGALGSGVAGGGGGGGGGGGSVVQIPVWNGIHR